MKWRVIEILNRAGDVDLLFHCENDGFIREALAFNESLGLHVCVDLAWLRKERSGMMWGYQQECYARVQHEKSLPLADPMDASKEGA